MTSLSRPKSSRYSRASSIRGLENLLAERRRRGAIKWRAGEGATWRLAAGVACQQKQSLHASPTPHLMHHLSTFDIEVTVAFSVTSSSLSRALREPPHGRPERRHSCSTENTSRGFRMFPEHPCTAPRLDILSGTGRQLHQTRQLSGGISNPI
ncbi:hypothetical protein E2C01_019041 [Portunus trituberculatus]|uniref:Uncharacterized protein n=1 Tax=Portunus trituberculatus TaxID=210409 RepID=A0A5B7DXZ3_PORTR|nr:hypothetical protein [Portunus trituberculatus]